VVMARPRPLPSVLVRAVSVQHLDDRPQPGAPALVRVQPQLDGRRAGGTGSLHGNVLPPRIWARFMGYAGDFALNRR